ncbi:dTDP-4-dehydrorhamnose reductase [Thermodesulfobacteriota bacterium]
MKILITGGTGQLGSDCARLLRKDHDVTAVGSKELNISHPREVEKAIQHFLPDILINCAAYTRVDDCETEKIRCRDVNVNGPTLLSKWMDKLRGILIHISSDYVFDGKKPLPEPYVESDSTSPLSEYGKTKLSSERAVQEAIGRHIIIRTAWMYGINGSNFLKTMLKLALTDSKKEIRVVNDQFGSPTWSRRLSLQISRMIEEDVHGIYHATSEGYCTWYELACYFLEKMDVSHNIIPCTTDAYPLPARRPNNSILENRRLKEEGIHVMKHWRVDLDQFISEFGQRLIKEESRRP